MNTGFQVCHILGMHPLSSAALAESHIPWLDEMDHLTMEAVAASRQKYCQYLLR